MWLALLLFPPLSIFPMLLSMTLLTSLDLEPGQGEESGT